MSNSAHVKSLDAVQRFAGSVAQFREEAQICIARLESEMRKIIGWLERDRPGFWKGEAESCDRRHAEARVSLHKCRMRRVGDFRPTCFEEQKHLQACSQQLEFARKQLGVVRHWTIAAHQEADEYYGRSTQLVQTLERDIPRLIALLRQSIEQLESYSHVRLPDWNPERLNFGDPNEYAEAGEDVCGDSASGTAGTEDPPPALDSDGDT